MSQPLDVQSESHLKVLSILHHVMAAIGLLGLALVVVYGVVLMSIEPSMFKTTREVQQWDALQPLFWGMIAGAALMSLVSIAINVQAGRMLAQKAGRGWIIAACCLNVLSIPLGTALAVFTLITINRTDVSQAFRANV